MRSLVRLIFRKLLYLKYKTKKKPLLSRKWAQGCLRVFCKDSLKREALNDGNPDNPEVVMSIFPPWGFCLLSLWARPGTTSSGWFFLFAQLPSCWLTHPVFLCFQEQRLVEDSSREVKKVRKARNRRLEWNMMAYDKEFRPDNRFSPSPYHMASSEGSLSPDNRQVLCTTRFAWSFSFFAVFGFALTSLFLLGATLPSGSKGLCAE